MACLTPMKLKTGDTVPCGRCAGCIQRKRNDWVIRLHNESMAAVNLVFLTFTYDEEHLVYDGANMVLNYGDLSGFWRSARKLGYRFKYFAVGEYGELSGRPHYHALVFFDYVVDDFTTMLNLWKHGFVHLGFVTGASIRYTLKDMLKETHLYEGVDYGIKPGIRCSKGIGANYIHSSAGWHKGNVKERCYIKNDGCTFAMPRYYKDKIYDEYERTVLKVTQKQEVKPVKDVVKERMNVRTYIRKVEALRKQQLKIRHFNKSI